VHRKVSQSQETLSPLVCSVGWL